MSTPSPLDKLRTLSSFNPVDLIPVIHGSHQAASDFISYQNIIANDPILRFDPAMLGESRHSLFSMMCQKTIRYHELFDLNSELAKKSVYQFPEQLICSVHHNMFMPQIRYLGTDDQLKKWLPLALTHQIMGCYAQTELGHGSDLQNLETEAIFHKETDTFIMNSPTLTSTKWWIGELGIVANHAIVQAQLIIDGKRFGVQSFIVQLRDLKTHKELLGIMAGEIGPKLGFNTKDNGYLKNFWKIFSGFFPFHIFSNFRKNTGDEFDIRKKKVT